MKYLLFLLFPLFTLTTHAQKYLPIEQVDNQWTTRDIKVGAEKKVSVLQLVTAFQKTWPTYSGNGLLDFAKQNRTRDDYNGIIIDTKNGFAQYEEE